MIDLELAHTAIYVISYLLSYIVIVTFVGYVRAHMVVAAGDINPAREGYLTLNPLQHVNPMWQLMFIALSYVLSVPPLIGLGRYFPINPLNIIPPRRYSKLALAYLSGGIAYFSLALVAVIVLVLSFGSPILGFVAKIMFERGAEYSMISPLSLAQYFPHHSPFLLVIALIMLVISYSSVALGALFLIMDMLHFGLLIAVDRSWIRLHYNHGIVMLGAMVAAWLLLGPILRIAGMVILTIGRAVAFLFGLA